MLRQIQHKQIDSNIQPKHQNICVKMLGGLGDCIIASSVALNVHEGCKVTLACPKHLRDAMEALGVVQTIALTDLNSETTRQRFDSIVEVTNSFIDENKKLTSEDYYAAVGRSAGIEITNIPVASSTVIPHTRVVYLHPGASNPNRRWLEGYWRIVAKTLASCGFEVVWLGARDEFGFSGQNITKLSDRLPQLAEQIEFMRKVWGYFIGNDSGYLHVAGVLRLPGIGIFGNTRPDNVIGRYKTLRGIFSQQGRGDATRTLDIADTNGIETICPETVIGKFLVRCVGNLSLAETPPQKEVLYVDNVLKAPSWAALYFDLREGTQEPCLYIDKASRVCLKAGDRNIVINATHPEMSIRGVREAVEVYALKQKEVI